MMRGFVSRNGAAGWFGASLLRLIIGFSRYYVRRAGMENLLIVPGAAGRGAA